MLYRSFFTIEQFDSGERMLHLVFASLILLGGKHRHAESTSCASEFGSKYRSTAMTRLLMIVESQCEAAGRASAVQKGLQRRCNDGKPALFKPAPQPFRIARENDRAVEGHGVGGKSRRVFMIDCQAMLGSDALLDGAQPVFGKSARVMDHVAGGQRTERRVEVIEACVGKLQGHAFGAEALRDDLSRLATRA